MPVIRHDAISQHPRRDLFECLGQHTLKGVIIAVVAENAYSPDRTIEDVKHKTARLAEASMWHSECSRPRSNSDACLEALD
jgi:hypothetical protein